MSYCHYPSLSLMASNTENLVFPSLVYFSLIKEHFNFSGSAIPQQNKLAIETHSEGLREYKEKLKYTRKLLQVVPFSTILNFHLLSLRPYSELKIQSQTQKTHTPQCLFV
ncbi:hypothetical protein CDL12_00265 [Handroanthus impetiginosus]|uniref:Uncharacterized protein n=1 Tax=Handroanthus impetiginosus TaxID=429701 RepID=A0A2G9IB53_9LAMI|nr:hypothetical protein CDL12_00265 [Handroanthus impetiginosus]